jgi:transcriptional regulator GlxA family with amidase domain
MARPVLVLIYPGFQTLDAVGPAEVFAAATRLVAPRPGYDVELVAARPGPVRATSGLELSARGFAGRRAVDTLLVAGGFGAREAAADARLIRQLRRMSARARRTASVCSGAFLLAQAGLLDGRRATTHWAACQLLAELHPKIRVERDPIFVRDGSIWTSAGVTAGMDLALALVEDDLGHKVALEVARWLVLYLQRPGGQSQFSAQLEAQRAERRPLRDLQAWIADHLDEDLSVPALARRAGMSPRHFARVFVRELGRTPAELIEVLRVESARRLLEASERSLVEVAGACGFGTVETLHRTFKRRLGVTPGDYRRRFA